MIWEHAFKISLPALTFLPVIRKTLSSQGILLHLLLNNTHFLSLIWALGKRTQIHKHNVVGFSALLSVSYTQSVKITPVRSWAAQEV